MQKVLDWFRLLSRQQRKQILLAAGVGAMLLGVWFSNQQTQVVSTAAPQPLVFDATIRVHVVGEVTNPGLYELNTGAIANDAIVLAGGFGPEAAEESVNLARVLTDGEQLVVLNRNQIVQSGGNGKISLNRSTAADFDSLPGIGPALAERIVEYRSNSGGFKSIEEITSVSGIGAKLFSQIRDQLTL